MDNPVLKQLALLASALAFLASPAAEGSVFLDSNCTGLKLKSASGVPGSPVHEYSFSGTCAIMWSTGDGERKWSRIVPANASARWDAASQEFSESFNVLASFEGAGFWSVGPGEVRTTFKCNDDPLISNAACGVVTHSNESGFLPFSNPAKKQTRPLLKGKTTLAEASKKSAESAPKLGIVPVPAGKPACSGAPLPWKGVAREPGPSEFEAEALFRSGKVAVTGGTAAVQVMRAFGGGWSGDEQLFWSGGSPGAVLEMMVPVPVAGRYRIELYLTRAPDYGDLQIQVDGNPAHGSVSGYATSVSASGAVDAGTYQLFEGEHRVGLKLQGKNAASGGHLAGIDRLRLVPETARR